MKSIGRLTKKVDKQEYEIAWKDDRLFEFPRTRNERLEMLRRFVIRECYDAWRLQDRKITALKKSYLSEILNSLS